MGRYETQNSAQPREWPMGHESAEHVRLGMHPRSKAVRMAEELLLPLLSTQRTPVGDDDKCTRVDTLRLDSLTTEGAHHVDRDASIVLEWAAQVDRSPASSATGSFPDTWGLGCRDGTPETQSAARAASRREGRRSTDCRWP